MTAPRGWGVTLSALIAASACGSSSKQGAKDAGGSLADAGAAADTLLGRVAAIVIPSCAVAGCHDAVSKTHSMDLSTPDKIVSAWVDQPGFDHCTGRNTPRVIPGDPAGSLVVMKIEGIAVCLQSQRMPLPPRDALTAEQIDVIGAWIAAGAPSDRPPTDAGEGDGGSLDAADDSAPDGGGPGSACTAASPCGPGLTCTGDACSDAWECMAHFDDTLEHPCAPETMLYCGCDGVTFEASVTCPDRPFSHPGACGDGESCFTGAVRCSDPAPVCPEGQAPSVVNDCYGPCIPVASCRCAAHYMCPNLAVYTCLLDTHCGPNPRLDTGTDTDGP